MLVPSNFGDDSIEKERARMQSLFLITNGWEISLETLEARKLLSPLGLLSWCFAQLVIYVSFWCCLHMLYAYMCR